MEVKWRLIYFYDPARLPSNSGNISEEGRDLVKFVHKVKFREDGRAIPDKGNYLISGS